MQKSSENRYIHYNKTIKRKLIILPVMLIAIVAVVVSVGSYVIINSYDHNTLFNLALMTLFVIVAFSMIVASLMHKNFVTRLDKVTSGIFGFLDYLSGKSSKVSYIDKGVGEISDAINEKFKEIEQNISDDDKFMAELISVLEAVKKGDYSKRVKSQPSSKALKEIFSLINDTLYAVENDIGQDLNKIIDTLKLYTQEDYTKSIEYPKGLVEKSINNLREVIVFMLKNSKQYGEDFQMVAQNVNEKVNRAYKNIDITITRELSKVIYSIDEVSKHIKANVESASYIHSYTDSVTQAAKEGEELAKKTINAMEEISQEVDKINEAISIIDKITMQTNILSLNAAVEASTAGEAGKGFAVVAQEVRNLASQTSLAAKEIQAVVDLAKEKAAYGNEISLKMVHGYNQLVKQVSKNLEIIHQITKNSNMQDEQILQINELVKNMQNMIIDSLNMLKEAEQQSHSNRERAKRLVEFTKKKKFEIA